MTLHNFAKWVVGKNKSDTLSKCETKSWLTQSIAHPQRNSLMHRFGWGSKDRKWFTNIFCPWPLACAMRYAYCRAFKNIFSFFLLFPSNWPQYLLATSKVPRQLIFSRHFSLRFVMKNMYKTNVHTNSGKCLWFSIFKVKCPQM